MIDPITRQIIRNAIKSAAGEMQTSLIKTAHSPLIYEVQDFGVGLLDARGRLIGEGSGLAGFLACLSPTVQNGMEFLAEEGFAEGDVILANEPYVTGTHISDTALYMPLFFAGRLVAFTIVMAHWSDIGGFSPGGWCAETTDVHQEGLIFPHTKLYEAGKLNKAFHQFILKNVRVPETVDGDLQAMISACGVGGDRFRNLCGRYGADRIGTAIDEIMALSEARMRREIAAIPSGVYKAEAFLDHDGINRDNPVRMAVSVSVEGDGITIDFTGSDPVAKGPINHPFVGTKALCGTIIKALTMPNDPTNEGHLRPIKVTAPDDTVVSARYPAPCDSYGYAAELIEYVVLRALAEVVPEQIPAPSYQMFAYHLVRKRAVLGAPFICLEPVHGGGGALPHDDGPGGMMFLGGGAAPNTPIEVLESSYPIRFERYSFNPENRGVGQYRGGYGVIREFRLLEDGAEIQLSMDNNAQPLWGLAGGGDAGVSVVVITHADGKEVTFTDRIAEYELDKEDVVSIRTANGGGWGDPSQRDPARIAQDIRNQFLSVDQAVEQYGVSPEAIEAALAQLHRGDF